MVMDMQLLLIGLGVLLLLAGLAWPLLMRSGLGRLPGDIVFHRGGTTFYFPLVTCIIISIVLSALCWLFNRSGPRAPTRGLVDHGDRVDLDQTARIGREPTQLHGWTG